MLFALAGLMIFASCKKDESTPDPLSKEDAEVALTEINSNFGTDLNSFENSTENLAMEAVNDLNLPFMMEGLMKAPLNQKNVTTEIKKVFDYSKGLKGDLMWDVDIPNNHGTYQFIDGQWTPIEPTPTDKIVVIFSYNGGNNNATLTFYDYSKKTVSYGGESVPYMSSLSCKLEIEGMTNPVMSWDYTASFSMNSSGVTMKMKFVYNLGEYSLTQAMSTEITGNETYTKFVIGVSEEIKKAGEVLRGASFQITMKEGQTSSTSIIAKFRVKNIIIKWEVMLDANTNTSGNPDDYMDISVWTASGAKVADVVFYLEEENYVPYFKFADGTELPISDLLDETFQYELEDFMNFFMYYK